MLKINFQKHKDQVKMRITYFINLLPQVVVMSSVRKSKQSNLTHLKR